MGRRFRSNPDDSGSLLASMFIIALGAGCCLFTVVAMSPSSMPVALWIGGGIMSVFVIIIVMQRFGRIPQGSLSFLLSSSRNRRDDGARDYEPRKVADGRSQSVGTNRPITAEEAHQIKVTSPNTWVPAASRRKK